MRKTSHAFLFGLAFLATAGAASAQGGADPAALSNGVAAQVLTLDGLRSDARIGGGPDLSPFAMAAASLGETGTGIDIPVATAKIGGGTDLSLPAGPLGDVAGSVSANMANALQGPDAGETGALVSTLVIGTAQPDLAGALGDQIRSEKRLGR